MSLSRITERSPQVEIIKFGYKLSPYILFLREHDLMKMNWEETCSAFTVRNIYHMHKKPSYGNFFSGEGSKYSDSCDIKVPLYRRQKIL